MKTGIKYMRRGNEGSALIFTMVIAMTVAISTASLMAFANYQIGATKRAQEDNVSIAVAEAGANAAYATIKTKFANKDNASLFPSTTYNGGTYKVTVTSVGSDKALIKSVGVIGKSTNSVMMDIRDFGVATWVTATGTFDEDHDANADDDHDYGDHGWDDDHNDAWSHSMYVNGRCTVNGSGHVYGSVRCNQDIQCNNDLDWGSSSEPADVSCGVRFSAANNCKIKGKVTSPTVSVDHSGGHDQIDSKVNDYVSTVSFPTKDHLAYHDQAVANNQVYNGTTYNSSQNFGAIPGGIRYYNGDVTFNGNCTFSGCIMATGNIKFNGSCNHTKVNNLPAICSRDGSVEINGSHQIHGLVSCAGNMKCGGNDDHSRIDGALLCGGNLTLSGNYGDIHYAHCWMDDHGDDHGVSNIDPATGKPVVASDVRVTAWQK